VKILPGNSDALPFVFLRDPGVERFFSLQHYNISLLHCRPVDQAMRIARPPGLRRGGDDNIHRDKQPAQSAGSERSREPGRNGGHPGEAETGRHCRYRLRRAVAGVGVDSAWEQKKLEARKILKNAAESPASSARFVSLRPCSART